MDGNVVVYKNWDKVCWASGTHWVDAWPDDPYMGLQDDGNLVIYFEWVGP